MGKINKRKNKPPKDASESKAAEEPPTFESTFPLPQLPPTLDCTELQETSGVLPGREEPLPNYSFQKNVFTLPIC